MQGSLHANMDDNALNVIDNVQGPALLSQSGDHVQCTGTFELILNILHRDHYISIEGEGIQIVTVVQHSKDMYCEV